MPPPWSHKVSTHLHCLPAQLLERRAALLEKSNQRRALLEDAYKYQQYERDCDETKGKYSCV